MKDLKDIQLEYHQRELLQESLSSSPYLQLEKWIDDVQKEEITYANAAILSTVGSDNRPSSRVVLIKEISENGLVFFTDYSSKKGQELNENPNASLLFFWKELDRQVRITGKIDRTSREVSEQYFKSRPHASKISAYSSHQSHQTTMEELQTAVTSNNSQYPEEVPCPPDWGGFILSYQEVEFWQGRPNRLHDRFVYFKENTEWKIKRLAP